jgi:hypothetical protein
MPIISGISGSYYLNNFSDYSVRISDGRDSFMDAAVMASGAMVYLLSFMKIVTGFQ